MKACRISPATGAYSIFTNNLRIGSYLEKHELHHIWQARALGDMFLPIYGAQSIFGLIMGQSLVESGSNFFETQGYYNHWFK